MPNKKNRPRSQKPQFPRKWEALTDNEKLDVITKVLTDAGSDRQFRKQCTSSDLKKVRAAVAKRAGVTFGAGMTVRFLPDEDAASKEIVLLLPDFVPAAPKKSARLVDAKTGWICTYITYRQSGL